ncbi:MAG: Holliday junction resolvase RuvX [Paludibacter sp.]|nr:Holliday junction resolvase RuvX [Paludibacter sp.]
MGRILAIDYGRKRVGLAVTDLLHITANGLDTIPAHEVLLYLQKYIDREPVDKFVVGLPKQMNGEDSDSMQYIRPFVVSLQRRFPDIELIYVDERFTSVLAHKTMIEAGLKKKDRQNKELVDKISATIILQSYLESIHSY